MLYCVVHEQVAARRGENYIAAYIPQLTIQYSWNIAAMYLRGRDAEIAILEQYYGHYNIMYMHVINCDIITQSPVSSSCPSHLHKYQKGPN